MVKMEQVRVVGVVSSEIELCTSVVGTACLTCFTDQLHLRSDVNYYSRHFCRPSFNIVSGDVCRRISGWNSARRTLLKMAREQSWNNTRSL